VQEKAETVRTEDSEIILCSYSHCVIEKDIKNSCWRKAGSSTNDTGETGYPHAED
jgi:hypothetical protein